MALPKEPRQKMINLMYLVLTALLALNVSSEILNAFKTVDASLMTSNGVIDDKNNTLFKSFQDKVKNPETKELAELWLPKAQKAKDLSDAVSKYIDDLKMTLKKEAGYNPPADTAFKEDDLEAATRMFVEQKKGEELKKKLEQFKKDLLAIDPVMGKELGALIPLNLDMPKNVVSEAAKQGDWGYTYFHMTPTVAALTILSKFQNDVKNSEAQVVDYCHRKTGEVQLIYDQFQAIASQSSEYVMPGQEFSISAGVGAFSKAALPTVSIDGQNIALNADGVAEYKTTVGGPGSYVKKVNIRFKKPNGEFATIDKEIKYTVGSPTGASVSADAVKVLYIGLDNPLSVSGGNVGDEKVSVSLDNGELTKQGGGKYIARPRTAGKANVTLNIEGRSQAFEFRVKNVPDPVAKVGNNKGGQMGVNEFKAQFGVRADLENFVFEGVKFNVTGFTIVLTGANFPTLQYRQVSGDSFDKVRDLIEKAKQGTTISIDEIKASGPGGTRTLAPIVFNLR